MDGIECILRNTCLGIVVVRSLPGFLWRVSIGGLTWRWRELGDVVVVLLSLWDRCYDLDRRLLSLIDLLHNFHDLSLCVILLQEIFDCCLLMDFGLLLELTQLDILNVIEVEKRWPLVLWIWVEVWICVISLELISHKFDQIVLDYFLSKIYSLAGDSSLEN